MSCIRAVHCKTDSYDLDLINPVWTQTSQLAKNNRNLLFDIPSHLQVLTKISAILKTPGKEMKLSTSPSPTIRHVEKELEATVPSYSTMNLKILYIKVYK